MIGIVGYGMVGKAVEYGFKECVSVIADPQCDWGTSLADVCFADPKFIFVCVPTPTDGTNYSILRSVLDEIKQLDYSGITVVKSTVLPHVLDDYDVVYNPEFLSRNTSFQDFVDPPFILIGGESSKSKQLAEFYKSNSIVDTSNIYFTDVKTAALAKYTMNSFYALKVTYMNAVYDIAQELGINYNDIVDILKMQPWMGTHHFQVPGPDGERGFGGPCLPKDSQAFSEMYNIQLLKTVLELNGKYRITSKGNPNGN